MGEDGEQEKRRRVELEMVCKMKSTFIFKIKLEKKTQKSVAFICINKATGEEIMDTFLPSKASMTIHYLGIN